MFINPQNQHKSFSGRAITQHCSAEFIGVRKIAVLIWTLQQFYLVLCTGNTCEEDEDGNKEADTEVQVDGGSWTFDRADQGERQDAEEEAK